MSAEREFYFNYFPNFYQHLKKSGKEKEARAMVKDLLIKTFNKDIDKKIDRFLQIPEIGFIPIGTKYFKLYFELYKLYTNGFYYSAIVLAGVLCERICYDILAEQEIHIGEMKKLSIEQIECMFEMNLHYLISLLHTWGLIKEKTKIEMLKVNIKRNQYVHPKKSDKNMAKDALLMLKRITKILRNEFEVNAMPMRRESS